MKIVQVEYRRLKTFGNYENETIGATAQVEDGESPYDTLQTVKAWVDGHLKIVEEDSDLSRKVWRAEARLRELNGLIKSAGERFEYAKKILAAHGIDVPNDHGVYDDDEIEPLPF